MEGGLVDGERERTHDLVSILTHQSDYVAQRASNTLSTYGPPKPIFSTPRGLSLRYSPGPCLKREKDHTPGVLRWKNRMSPLLNRKKGMSPLLSRSHLLHREPRGRNSGGESVLHQWDGNPRKGVGPLGRLDLDGTPKEELCPPPKGALSCWRSSSSYARAHNNSAKERLTIPSEKIVIIKTI